MRRRVFEIIEVGQENDKHSKVYDVIMMITIIVSILPLAFKRETTFFLCWIK